MKIPRIAARVVVCLIAGVASATSYYVDASGGDDARDGQSAATAWKTITKVNGSTFAAGDQILFKRGEVWREGLVPPSSGAAGNPIRFDAYGTGEPPTITGYLELAAGSWTQDSGNIWKAAVTATGMNYVLFRASLWGLTEAIRDPAGVLFGKITVVLNAVAAGVSALSVIGHLDKASRGE